MTPDAKAEECAACDAYLKVTRDGDLIGHDEVCERHHALLVESAKREAELRALLTAKDVEIERLRAFESAIFHAWEYAQVGGKGSKNPIIRARKPYRLVREALEARRALKEATQ